MTERRRRERLPFIQMDARVQVRKGFMSKEWVNVQVMDFSSLGMAFVGDHEFDEGQRVQFSLNLATEVGNITVEQASATIRNSRVGDEGTIFGVEFQDLKGPVASSLERIENILSRYNRVTERMQT
ncbi:PilZ domain-containing protein [Tamilnaduibacter salinus]|nr:PilZ domain-containing protein [Tamilnaduibacter salinus]